MLEAGPEVILLVERQERSAGLRAVMREQDKAASGLETHQGPGTIILGDMKLQVQECKLAVMSNESA